MTNKQSCDVCKPANFWKIIGLDVMKIWLTPSMENYITILGIYNNFRLVFNQYPNIKEIKFKITAHAAG